MTDRVCIMCGAEFKLEDDQIAGINYCDACFQMMLDAEHDNAKADEPKTENA